MQGSDKRTRDTKGSVLSSLSESRGSVLLGTAIARIEVRDRQYFPIRILIDCGSQRSFITSACAQSLGLEQNINHQPLHGFGDNPSKGGNFQVCCTLVPQHSLHPRLKKNTVIIPKITNKIPSCPIPNVIHEHFQKYDLADKAFGKSGPIDFLLGADLFGQILSGECVSKEGYPNALKTIFGWVIMGSLTQNSSSKEKNVTLMSSCQLQLPNELNDSTEKFWEIETVPQVVQIGPRNAAQKNRLGKHHFLPPLQDTQRLPSGGRDCLKEMQHHFSGGRERYSPVRRTSEGANHFCSEQSSVRVLQVEHKQLQKTIDNVNQSSKLQYRHCIDPQQMRVSPPPSPHQAISGGVSRLSSSGFPTHCSGVRYCDNPEGSLSQHFQSLQFKQPVMLVPSHPTR
ncbi:uncharacterized protein [Halyomorpha halys]|uniref:uncharacterized protein n=1 Tax=Halyomorpha halys TaxID=286706 RepID=UPI0034D1D72B